MQLLQAEVADFCQIFPKSKVSVCRLPTAALNHVLKALLGNTPVFKGMKTDICTNDVCAPPCLVVLCAVHMAGEAWSWFSSRLGNLEEIWLPRPGVSVRK